MGNMETLCMQCRGIGPQFTAKDKSHSFSRVAVGTQSIFPSYGGDGHSNLEFVQRHQESCLVTRNTAGISLSLCRAIQTVIEVSQETQGTFLVATVILGFLSIFNNSQASSPFEALNSTCLSRCQRDVKPPVHMKR